MPPFEARPAPAAAAVCEGPSCGNEETPGLGWRGACSRGQSGVESMGRREACGAFADRIHRPVRGETSRLGKERGNSLKALQAVFL